MQQQLNIQQLVNQVVHLSTNPRESADKLARRLKEAGHVRYLREVLAEFPRQRDLHNARLERQNRSGDPLHARRRQHGNEGEVQQHHDEKLRE